MNGYIEYRGWKIYRVDRDYKFCACKDDFFDLHDDKIDYMKKLIDLVEEPK